MSYVECAAILAGLLVSANLWAQKPILTADQVLDKFVEATGGTEKFAGILTLYEKWDVTGDLTDHVPAGRAPTQFKSHGQGEFYFKAPTLRIALVRSDRNDFVAGTGCDGKDSWTYSPSWGTRKYKPTAEHEYLCQPGMSPFPAGLRREKAKLELKGQKEVAGRKAFVIRAELLPDQTKVDLYIDSENYLLLRVDSRRGLSHFTELYSDYRDVEGIKVPFRREHHTDNTDQTIKVLEVRVNAPIDDRVFLRPK